MMRNHKLLLGLALAVLFMASCKKEETFSQNTYDEYVRSIFPVKNFDNTYQQWASIGFATARITINGTPSEEYQVGIYLENPKNNNKVTKLYEGKISSISSSTRLNTAIPFLLAQPTVWVMVVNSEKHYVIQKAAINYIEPNYILNTTITWPTETFPATGHLPSEASPFAFRYLFEEDFPDAGDFDYNDCVITVIPEIAADNAKKVTLTVRAEAAGAQKTLGAGLRLVGITDGLIESKVCTQQLPAPPANLGEYKNIPDGDFTKSNTDQSSLVLLLCKDMHWVMNPVEGTNGGITRQPYNTRREGERVAVKEAKYEFVFKNEATARNMMNQEIYDCFIVEPYNGSFWEVHTVQNGRKGDLVLHYDVHGKTYQEYLNAYVNSGVGKVTWALLVPGTVAYPYEGIRITEAYNQFEGWGQNMNNNTQWYLYPTFGNVWQ